VWVGISSRISDTTDLYVLKTSVRRSENGPSRRHAGTARYPGDEIERSPSRRFLLIVALEDLLRQIAAALIED